MKLSFRRIVVMVVSSLALLAGPMLLGAPSKSEKSKTSAPKIWSAGETQHSLWTGICRNATYGGDGRLKIYLVENGPKVIGYVSISGELVGSGDLKGTHVGSALSVSSSDPVFNVPINWHGRWSGDRITGEYSIDALAHMETTRQVGEWAVDLVEKSKGETPESEAGFRGLFALNLEIGLNRPVQRRDGTVVTGAQALFDSIHPAGTGVSVNVTNVEIEWNEGASQKKVNEIHRYSVDYTLFWQGIVQKTGTTKMRLTYNAAIDAVTSHEVISSTGLTNGDVGKIAFSVGALLGKAALDSILDPER